MGIGEEHPSQKTQVQSPPRRVCLMCSSNKKKATLAERRRKKMREAQTDTEAQNMHILAFWGVIVENLPFTVRLEDPGGVTHQVLHCD